MHVVQVAASVSLRRATMPAATAAVITILDKSARPQLLLRHMSLKTTPPVLVGPRLKLAESTLTEWTGRAA